MVNAAKWLEEKYSKNGTCTRVEDKENYGKTRNKVKYLDANNQSLEGGWICEGKSLE